MWKSHYNCKFEGSLFYGSYEKHKNYAPWKFSTIWQKVFWFLHLRILYTVAFIACIHIASNHTLHYIEHTLSHKGKQEEEKGQCRQGWEGEGEREEGHPRHLLSLEEGLEEEAGCEAVWDYLNHPLSGLGGHLVECVCVCVCVCVKDLILISGKVVYFWLNFFSKREEKFHPNKSIKLQTLCTR